MFAATPQSVVENRGYRRDARLITIGTCLREAFVAEPDQAMLALLASLDSRTKVRRP